MNPETTTIQLGEKQYTIAAQPFRRARAWRKRFADDVKPIFDKVATAQDMTFERPEDLLQLWPLVETLLFEGLDALFELLIAYDPQLEADRELIEDTATDKQILAAFREVLRVADPFGMLAKLERSGGLSMNGISSSLALPSGDSTDARQSN